MRLQSAVYRYVEERTKAGRFRNHTPKGVGYSLDGFAASCGDIDTGQLTRRHVQRWLEAEYERVAASTLYRKFSECQVFCAWLRQRGLLKSDPFRDLEPPKKPDYVPRSLTAEQTEKLFANLPDIRAELVCSLIFQSALRIGEVATLQVGRIDFKTWQATVVGKGDKERVVPIFDETQPILRAYLSQFPARTGPLIRSYLRPTQGVTAVHLGRLVSAWMYEAGIKEHAFDGVSAHAGRHTAATDTYEQSKDIRAVQQFLGHSSLETTQRYIRGSAENVRRAGAGRTYRRIADAAPRVGDPVTPPA